MENLNYEIKFTNNKETVDMALPNGESIKLLVKDEAGQPRKFYLATDLHKALGSDESKKPVNFLRSRHGKEQMIVRLEKAYENEDLDIVSIRHLLETADKEGLPQWILDHFVLTTRGRFGGTWMERDIFLTYAMWISPELHALAVDCLGRYGHVEVAPVNKQAELLVEEARKSETRAFLEAQALEVTYDDLDRKQQAKITAHTSARLKQMEATGQLRELIALTWGTDPSDGTLASIISTTEGIINRVAVGASRQVLADNLGIAYGTYSREALSAPSLNCVAAVTAEISQYLLDCIEEEVVPSLTEYKAEVGSIAKRARKNIIFRGGRETRIIAERKRTGGKKETRGLYQVELKQNLEVESIYTPLDKDKK